MKTNSIYQEGYQAQLDGLEEWDNPYPYSEDDCSNYWLWFYGYSDSYLAFRREAPRSTCTQVSVGMRGA